MKPLLELAAPATADPGDPEDRGVLATCELLHMTVTGHREGPLREAEAAADWLRMRLDWWKPTAPWSPARTYDAMVKALAELALALAEFTAWLDSQRGGAATKPAGACQSGRHTLPDDAIPTSGPRPLESAARIDKDSLHAESRSAHGCAGGFDPARLAPEKTWSHDGEQDLHAARDPPRPSSRALRGAIDRGRAASGG